MDRLQQLKQFAQDEPDDPFNLYALALEYLKTENKESGRLFAELVDSHPDYLPTYYPYAQLLVERKDVTGAEKIYQLGIERAKSQKQLKTLGELQAAYNDWKYELE
ncbi:hypothetical protein BH09BAC3_BH09BAC3_12510 [soil metagenome]